MENKLNLLSEIFNPKESTSRKKVTIAYLIMVHRLPEQFYKMFTAIYDSENIYLISIDKKADVEIVEKIKFYLKRFTNVFVIVTNTVTWGGYSMIQAELNGIEFLLKKELNWHFFINLSGQDYPLKSQMIIRNFLTDNKGKNFLKIIDQKRKRPETMNRIENYFEESNNEVKMISTQRKYLKNVAPYIGGQWMILSRNCCEFFCNSNEIQKFKDFYINTLIPDESFFQTVLMNSSFKGEIVNDDKRSIIWIPDGDIKLRPKTFTIKDFDFLLLGQNMFARKFDDNVDGNIIKKLKFNFHLDFANNKLN